MTSNCQIFNPPDSEYYQESVHLQNEINDLFSDVVAILNARVLLQQK